MAKEKSVVSPASIGGLPTFESGAATPWSPEISQIIQREDISPSEKRRALLVQMGVRKPRQKYKTKKLRKVAATKRRKERKEARGSIFEQYGLTPRVRGPKLTDDQKKTKRSERGKRRRSLFREMAKANPEMAKKFGIDPSRFKL